MRAARLHWQFPPGQENSFSIEKDLVVIGRSRDCDITLLDERVSRQHTEIYFDGDAFLVSDLGSYNGTLLNGKLLENTRPLQQGDQLQIGPVTLRFETQTPSKQDSAPPTESRPTKIVPDLAAQPYLEISTGASQGIRFELIKPKTIIGRAGRGDTWDINLQDRAVSRPHAQIVRQGGDFLLSDLESANGTLVNGQRLTAAHKLTHGDELVFGQDILIFRAGKD
jgi:pSer/pThr/pTyr-binding forkhead associated (FHA) protein